jgi:hypothetical protein
LVTASTSPIWLTSTATATSTSPWATACPGLNPVLFGRVDRKVREDTTASGISNVAAAA